MKPTCKQCERENRKYSIQEPMYGTTTLLCLIPGYWDEDGVYHKPKDPNRTTYNYICSNGHTWSESR